MPYPPIYIGGQDDDRTRSIDVVHIEPSIREGVHLTPSLYGKDASVPLYRFGPVNTVAPWITGPETIPGTLRVQTGQWTGSPSPDFAFQWMSDGVDIPGANDIEWESIADYTDTTITVEVRGFNYIGQDYALTAGFDIQLIEDLDVFDADWFAITGLHEQTRLKAVDERTVLISGLAAENRLDVNRSVAYFTTGMAAEDRQDVNGANMAVITGVGQEEYQSVLETPGAAVITYKLGDPLVDSVPQLLDIKNYDAELANEGWVRFGVAGYVGGSSNEGGLGNFWGGADVDPGQLNQPYTYIYQDVPMYEQHLADINLGDCNLVVGWHQYSGAPDQANVRVEFYDVNDIKTGEDFGPGLWASPSNIWFYRELEADIPANTTYVRIFLEFNWQAGENNDARIDAVYPRIRKGVRLTSRDEGPDFEMWRLNCTFANSYQGTALSEIEFRATSGGADLATGGTPLFGSVGLGVTDANFAFDDLRNTGYWAGELLGVPNGTAWIGYDFGAPVFPEEIDLTARSGGFANQMGRSFYLEGSHDGINWNRVQEIPESEVGTFAEGQQKQIKIPNGVFLPYYQHPDYNGYDFRRNVFNTLDDRSVGVVFRARSRLNIDTLHANLQPDSATFNYRMGLFRMSTQKNGSFGNLGMITEVLETVDTTSDGVAEWKDVPLLQSHAIEVGEIFLVLFQDTDFVNNHDINPGEQRIWYIQDFNNNVAPPSLIKVADRISPWRNNDTNIPGVGYVNPTSFDGGGLGTYWAVDFSGSIF